MSEVFTDSIAWLGSRGSLSIPLAVTVWIAWGDLRTRRIPNYLTVGTAITGLAYNLAMRGWGGLWDGVLGLILGFALLIIPYIWGGMGAGDVKALAALGAWLGPQQAFFLFCYMGVAGGLIAVGLLWWKGLLWQKMRRGLTILVNMILCRSYGLAAPAPPSQLTEGIPYGVAMVLGMIALVGMEGRLIY